ncbi:MAG TPA: sigma-70 family RNA polymerase sigma factor, partial [Chloroflexota bacterium]|nr:sigma-70 family RNA polymerase sigma factor [Chloroflexota bacterium]
MRFCHHLIGDGSVAEDLAQEALLRAWQHADQLRDPASRDGWLTAIARNLCRHWLRERRPVGVPMSGGEADDGIGLAGAEPADEFDLEVELDRQDLAALLDQAMALLPVETRQILVERFVRETPLAEAARRLGLSEGAVAMRLQRGKLALRRVLVTVYPEELASHGIGVGEEGKEWRPTRIWCPLCGRHRLEGILVRRLGLFRLRCPDHGRLNDSLMASLFNDAPGYRGALTRLLIWSDRLYKYSFDHSTVACHGCGRRLSLQKDVDRPEPLVSYYC